MKRSVFLIFFIIAAVILWLNYPYFFDVVKSAKLFSTELPLLSGFLFVSVYCAVVPFSFPALLMNGFGTFLFGFETAVFLNMFSSVLSSVFSFYYGQSFIKAEDTDRWINSVKQKFPQLNRTVGWYDVAVVRSMMIPFTAVSYTMGIIGVRFQHYLLGTVIGSAPGTIISTYFIGQSFEWISDGDWMNGKQWISFLMSFLMIALLGVIRFAVVRILNRKLKRKGTVSNEELL